MRRHLELDLEQVKRVHAEHGNGARADSGERVVLNKTMSLMRNNVGWYDAHDCMCREEAWLGEGIRGGHALLRRLSF